jgi:Glycosyltransferase family 87
MVGAAIRRRFALLAALAVFVIGGVALGLTHHQLPLPLPRAQAIAVALHNPRVHRQLSINHWNRIEVDSVDDHLERVTFLAGSQVVEEVAVNRDRTLVERLDFNAPRVPYGNWIAYEPGVLLLLAALFMLATAVTPWRRMRNLDVLMALSLLAPVTLLQHRYVGLSVVSALPGLLYLAGRCARLALFQIPAGPPSRPVLDLITPGWNIHQRVRLMRLLAIVMGLILLFVTVSSFDAVDVVYAVMEGATKLLHGVLPYGHLPGDVIHGDTYPLLSYAFYAPLAWLAPVQSTWDSVDLALVVTGLAALLTGWAIFRVVVGRGGRGAPRMAPERELAGLRSALAWLAFPPVLIIASSGTSDVILGAIVALALLLWRRPGSSSALLAAAAWFKLAPLALLPVRLASLRGGRLIRALVGIVLVTAPMVALLIALGGTAGPMAMLHAISFQFSRQSPQSVWSALGISGLQPVGEAAVLAFITAAVVRLRQEPDLAESRQRMAALTVVILVGLQLVANYWAFLYLVWIFPLLAMSVLGEPVTAAVRSEALAPLPREVGLSGAPA